MQLSPHVRIFAVSTLLLLLLPPGERGETRRDKWMHKGQPDWMPALLYFTLLNSTYSTRILYPHG